MSQFIWRAFHFPQKDKANNCMALLISDRMIELGGNQQLVALAALRNLTTLIARFPRSQASILRSSQPRFFSLLLSLYSS